VIRFSHIDQFKSRVNKEKLWSHYRVRTAITTFESRSYIIALYIDLVKNSPLYKKILLQTPRLTLMDETRELASFNDFFPKLFHSSRSIKIGNTSCSLGLINGKTSYAFYDSYIDAMVVGRGSAGHLLSKNGNPSSYWAGIRTRISSGLLLHDPPYDSLEDALSILGIYPGEENPEENNMIPRISIFAPVYLSIGHVELCENLLSIWLTASDKIQFSEVKFIILGPKGKNRLRKHIKLNTSSFSNEASIRVVTNLGSRISKLKISLFYRGLFIEEREIYSPDPNINKSTPFLQTILNRVDPKFEVLRFWLTGLDSKGFEKAITMLLSGLGLYAIHVGDKYEEAGLQARRQNFVTAKCPIDIIVWTEVIGLVGNVYRVNLCQCATDKIDEKISDIKSISESLKKTIQSNEVRIFPTVITPIPKDQLVMEIKKAEANGVKIVTREILDNLIDSLITNNNSSARAIQDLLSHESRYEK